MGALGEFAAKKDAFWTQARARIAFLRATGAVTLFAINIIYPVTLFGEFRPYF